VYQTSPGPSIPDAPRQHEAGPAFAGAASTFTQFNQQQPSLLLEEGMTQQPPIQLACDACCPGAVETQHRQQGAQQGFMGDGHLEMALQQFDRRTIERMLVRSAQVRRQLPERAQQEVALCRLDESRAPVG
jgi:hypothetical protein